MSLSRVPVLKRVAVLLQLAFTAHAQTTAVAHGIGTSMLEVAVGCLSVAALVVVLVRRLVHSRRRTATDGLEAEKGLSLSEALDHAGIGMFLVDSAGSFLDVNRALCDITGFTAAELKANSFEDITHSEDLDGGERQLWNFADHEAPQRVFEKRLITANGEVVRVRISLSRVDNTSERLVGIVEDVTQASRTEAECEDPVGVRVGYSPEEYVGRAVRATALSDASGKPAGLPAVVTDGTARKAAEEALRLSEERFRIAAEIASDLICEWDIAANRVHYFASHIEQIGISRADLPHDLESAARMIHPDDREGVFQAVRRYYLDRRPLAMEFRALLRDGSVRHYSIRATALWNSQSVPYKWIGAISDITGRKQAEQGVYRLAAIVQSSHAAIWSTGLDLSVVSWNGGAEQLFGYSFDEIKGKSIVLLAPEDRVTEIERSYAALSVGDSICEFESLQMKKDGGTVPVSLTICPIRDSSGRITGYSGIAHDISGRQDAEAVLRESEERFRKVFEESPIGMAISESGDQLLRANAALCKMLGYEEAELLGKTFSELSHSDYASATALHKEAIFRGENPGPIEKKYFKKNGDEIWANMTATLVRNERQRPYIVVIVQDITQRKKVEDLLSYRAMHDRLTGLPNRHCFENCLAQALASAHRDEAKIALFYIDLDGFKLVNDTLGHSTGDLLLRQVAFRLQSCMRQSDTLARPGGDEFVVLAAVSGTEAAKRIAEKLLNALSQTFPVAGHELFVTASIGISIYPEDGAEASSLHRHAEVAMYEAKRRGKHSYRFFTPTLGAATRERLHLETDLRWALERKEFELYYQPQLRLATNEVVGFEALIRWRHPTSGMVQPSRFLSLAEETGLIVPIGLWALEEACRMLCQRRQKGLKPLRIAVNASVVQFARPDFVDSVQKILETTGVDATLLDLELTESLFMQDLEDAARKIARLRGFGIRIAIDDFGTGYSSFSYLQRLPIDALKIDRSFVQDSGQFPGALPLLRAMNSLAKDLGLRVIVEGIENEAQLRVVREIGCDEAQGFLLGVPAPAGKTGLELLSEHLASASHSPKIKPGVELRVEPTE